MTLAGIMVKTKLPWSGLVAALAIALPASANADTKHSFSVDVSGGVEYTDNLTVTELDRQAQKEDYAAVLNASVGWRGEAGKDDVYSAGYFFSQSSQFELSDFDLQIHGLNLSYAHTFGAVEAGLGYRYFFTFLGGDDLLDLHQVAPFISWTPIKKLRLKGEFAYKDKDLKGRTDRDAETMSGELQASYFLKGRDTYVTALGRYEDEDATGPEFDFEAVVLKTTLKTRLPVGGPKNRLALSIEHESRDYSSVTPAIGKVRDDDRLTLGTRWTVPLTKRIYVEADYEHRAFDSNLPSADLTENTASLTVGYEF